MGKIFLISIVVIFFSSLCYAQGDVYVHGYYRKDGTYVRPHYRSSPDGIKSNNYGRASYRQRQQYQNLPVIPSYRNDYDNDGVPNCYDYDDNNDGIMDDYDSSQYGKSRYSQPYTYTPPSTPFYDSYDSNNDYDFGYDSNYYDSGDY
ncbi:MAG: hypothetical protein DRP68_05100 [Candidatus Omnitrophota bacterium]|nr:MAG: hypothetical protein DRP68_05100 [Candidatus Omnitrophota bacterium]